MSINFNKIGSINSIYNNQKVDGKKGVQEASKAGSKRDNLQISKEAMDFQTVLKSVKAVNNLPDIREDVIAPIAEKLDKGTYNVDSKDIAEKLLANKFKRI